MQARDVVATLESEGFVFERHVDHGRLYVHPDGRRTTVPGRDSDDVNPKTLAAIRRQTGLTLRQGK